MESRTLLAGNVTASIVDGNLKIDGDASANDIAITETAAGIVVQGLNGTTINGAAGDFTAFASTVTTTGSVLVKLGAGNDKIQFSGVTLDKAVAVFGEDGNDQFGLVNTTVHGRVTFLGGVGDDTFYAEGSTFDTSVSAWMGDGNDLVALTNSDVKKNLSVLGGLGNDRLSIDGGKVENWLLGLMNEGNDDVRIANNAEVKHAHLRGGRGSDLIQTKDAKFTQSLYANLGLGNDSMSLEGTTSVTTRFIVRGGRGDDKVDIGTATLPASKQLLNVTEGTVDAALITARMTDPTTGLIAAVSAARNAFVNPVTVSGTGVYQANGGTVSTATSVDVEVSGLQGQTFEVDKDGDGFDDGSVTLDATGKGKIAVALANLTAAASNGVNTLLVRQVNGGTQVGSTRTVSVQYTESLKVRIATTMGDINIDLLDEEAPITVKNFMNYLTRYQGSIIHRSAHLSDGSDFIIQGGGFDLANPPKAIVTDAPITNEFNVDNSNLRGTLSMALPSNGPNLGTSQWFINTADNDSLDANLHTVFGHVDDAGMAVADAIHALTSVNLIGPTDNQALGEVPLDGYTPFTTTLAGTVSVTTGTTTVTGVGTNFTSALKANAAIQIGGVSYTVLSITSDTQLTLKSNATATVTAGTAKANAIPTDAQYVRITSVSVIPQLS